MSKMINYDTELRGKVLAGVSKISKAVSSTLGPKGRTVAISRGAGIHLTKDGVTVAKAVELKDPFENIGASLVREASSKTNDKSGDGTTGTVVLCESIYKNGLKYVSMGANAVQVKNGIDKAAKAVIKYVEGRATPISGKDAIKQVAKISANNDEEIAEVIADVFSKLGTEGTIKVEDGRGTEMASKIVEGMVIERGWLSPYFVTNEAMEADLSNPWILVTEKKLSNLQEIIPLLQDVSTNGQGRPLLIIAENVEGDALSTLVINKLKGFPVCAVQAPSYGDNKKAILRDIAALCGGQVVSDELGVVLNQVNLSCGIVGSAKNVIVSKDQTTIVGGCSDKAALDKYVASIKVQIDAAKDEFDKKKLTERYSKLTSGIGVISVGATTETELAEKKDRVDDAFNSAKNSIKSGIVPGGGVMLLEASQAVNFNKADYVGDEWLGAEILRESLSAPAKRILDNAGETTELIIAKLLEKSTLNGTGYNVLKKEYVDMVADGVVDPAAVIISEVENASSIAGLLLTTDCGIVDDPEDAKKSTPQMPPMM